MQVFKAALRIVSNHPVYLLVYVGFLSLMGVFIAGSINIGGNEGEYLASKTPFAVIDRDGSDLSRGLVSFLEENGQFVDVVDEPYALQDAVATGEARYLLVIPSGYGDTFLEAARTGSSMPALQSTYSFATMGGTLVDQQVNQYLGLVWATTTIQPDEAMSQILSYADEAVSTSAEVETIQTPAGAMPADRFAFYLQWGTYTMTASIVVCVGLLMSAFNRTDVHRRNLISPVSSLRLGLWKAAACLSVTIGVWAVTCGIGLLAFGYTLAGLPPQAIALVLASALVYSLVPLALGFLLGQLGASDMLANSVGNIVGMVMSFLGGAWISLDLLAPEVQAFSRFIPTSWYVDAVYKGVHLTDMTVESIAPILGDLGIVALFAVTLFAVALAAGRIRMRSADAGGNAGAALKAS